jgi:hypothetical protein
VPINPSAVGSQSGPTEAYWTSKDCLLYALGVGCGTEDLAFTTENSAGVAQRVLPTFACTAIAPERLRTAREDGLAKVGTFNRGMVVHGEQGITLHGALPTEAEFLATSTITGIYDKGSGAVIASESTAVDKSSGERLFTTRTSLFIRGEGGFGGDRGPGAVRIDIDRPPDHTLTFQTRLDQALLYRLNGDRNRLHSDPAFAKAAGFDRPIVHGLCTFGFTGRALLRVLCDDEPERFVSMDARFSRPVFPGDELTVSIWDEGERALFRTAGAGGEVVLDSGVCRYRRA